MTVVFHVTGSVELARFRLSLLPNSASPLPAPAAGRGGKQTQDWRLS